MEKKLRHIKNYIEGIVISALVAICVNVSWIIFVSDILLMIDCIPVRVSIFITIVVLVFIVAIILGTFIERKRNKVNDAKYICLLHEAYDKKVSGKEKGVNIERYNNVKSVLYNESDIYNEKSHEDKIKKLKELKEMNAVLRIELEAGKMYMKAVSFLTCAISLIASVYKNNMLDIGRATLILFVLLIGMLVCMYDSREQYYLECIKDVEKEINERIDDEKNSADIIKKIQKEK